MKLKAIITDDEELARENLKIQLHRADSDLEVVAEASNGEEALTLILHYKPDVVFLDIQMPVKDGFEVAEALMLADDLPEIVFVTAYDQYALKAFEVGAAHYLLKPVTKERLTAALDRIKVRLRERTAAKADAVPATASGLADALLDAPPTLSAGEAELVRLMNYLRSTGIAGKNAEPNAEQKAEPKLTGLASKVRGKLMVIKLEDINHITADEKVNFIHTDAGEFITDYTLDDLERRLDATLFMRIHRSHLVNIRKVKTLIPWFAGKFKVILDDAKQTELSLSRFRLDEMRKRLLW